MSWNSGMRSCARSLMSSKLLLPKTANRKIHSTVVKRMGGHGHDEPYYMHAKHMYNLDRMKNRKLKMSLAVFTALSIGVGVPVYAVVFQQRKAASA